ncbi:MAG: hypothetical protein DU480_03585 [Nitrosomonas sp.]|uniref:hypothetical protein n=1 Tax=Nitrosomonas sp. TaxID=42353 RepID=UPI0032EF5145
MGGKVGIPINEAVYLLNELEPDFLENARSKFPLLKSELILGREGGEQEPSDELNLDRAEVMIKALDVAKKRADNELESINKRIRASRKRRLWSQIASLICSSGVLAAISLSQSALTVISAFLALLASIGTIISDHQEKLLKQGDGDIYVAYEEASQASYKAALMAENIRLLIKHRVANSEVSETLKSANALCEDLNKWITRMSGSS